MAARRSFVQVKQVFIEAVAGLAGPRADWLRHQVRHAKEPLDLWLLRGAVFAALRTSDQADHRREQELHRALDSVFPDTTHSAPAPWGA
ncbi:MAG: hypothetical protein HUU30_12245 [Burkholderiaceae bacterium]|jgi:hypothetical protein|nr:hypothetical protein [Burkholderiaceae bacterium]